jgi:hypothetical protein
VESGAPDNAGDDRLEALEPAHLEAFAAFRRPASAPDSAVANEPTASQLHPSLNVRLARRVFQGEEGTVDLVPGPGSICYVCITAATGETTVGHTTIESAARDGVGHVRSAGGSATTFAGALPAGAHDLRIIDKSGRAIPVALSEDGGYWTTVAEPIDMKWNTDNGTEHQSVFGRLGMHRVINPPRD